jgi:hypothetical protein
MKVIKGIILICLLLAISNWLKTISLFLWFVFSGASVAVIIGYIAYCTEPREE